jgi:hypothetical protein
MKFPVIDFIDIIVDDLKNNNTKIETLYHVVGILNNQRFFKSSILPEISVEEYAQIIFGVFFKIKHGYSNEKLEKMFKSITLFIYCSTNYTDNKMETCDECYGNGSQTCEVCDRSGVVECSECNGTGSVTDDEGDTEDCYDCNGNGNNPCYNCEGEGEVYCNNCDGDGEVQGDEFFDYSLYLTAGLMDKSEYKTLYTYKSYDDPDIIEIISDLRYSIDLYEYSGTLEEGDSLFNTNEVVSSSYYFFGLLDNNKKNDKYSNFRIGTIEEYI